MALYMARVRVCAAPGRELHQVRQQVEHRARQAIRQRPRDMLTPMIVPLAANAAVQADIGLLAFMIGTGILVNGLIIFIVVRAIGERRQNAEDRRNSTLGTADR